MKLSRKEKRFVLSAVREFAFMWRVDVLWCRGSSGSVVDCLGDATVWNGERGVVRSRGGYTFPVEDEAFRLGSRDVLGR